MAQAKRKKAHPRTAKKRGKKASKKRTKKKASKKRTAKGTPPRKRGGKTLASILKKAAAEKRTTRFRYDKDGNIVGVYVPLKHQTKAEQKRATKAMVSACSAGAYRQGVSPGKTCGYRGLRPSAQAGRGLAYARWGFPKGWPKAKRMSNPGYIVEGLTVKTFRDEDGDWGWAVFTARGEPLAIGSGEPSEKVAAREGKAEAQFHAEILSVEGRRPGGVGELGIAMFPEDNPEKGSGTITTRNLGIGMRVLFDGRPAIVTSVRASRTDWTRSWVAFDGEPILVANDHRWTIVGEKRKKNPYVRLVGGLDLRDPRLLEVSDLYMAGLNKQAKKKLSTIPKGSLSSSDQRGYDTLHTNLHQAFVNPKGGKKNSGTNWWSPGQKWMEKEAKKEYQAQLRAHTKRGRKKSTFRYFPPQWQQDAVEALGDNDEERFKAIKMGQLGTTGLPPLRGAKKRSKKKATKRKKNPISVRKLVNDAMK